MRQHRFGPQAESSEDLTNVNLTIPFRSSSIPQSLSSVPPSKPSDVNIELKTFKSG